VAGGRFLSGDDPTISPDARVRASVGVGNDCEPYVDPLIGLYYPIAPPGVWLPSCFAVDQTRALPGVEAILERIYAGATPQIKLEAIGELERAAIEVLTEKLSGGLPMSDPFVPMLADIDTFRVGGNVVDVAAGLQRIAQAGQVLCGANSLCIQAFNGAIERTVNQGGDGMGILDTILSGAGAIGGVLGPVIQALPQLAQAGIIRGDVGAFFNPNQGQNMIPSASQGSPVGFDATFAALLPQLGRVAGMVPGVVGSVGGALSIADTLGLLGAGGGGGCGVARGAVMAPSLFRTNACGKTSLPARTQVMGPDGAIYVVANLGRATRGSREAGVMRRLARDNGFTVGRRGSTGGRRRPRSPR